MGLALLCAGGKLAVTGLLVGPMKIHARTHARAQREEKCSLHTRLSHGRKTAKVASTIEQGRREPRPHSSFQHLRHSASLGPIFAALTPHPDRHFPGLYQPLALQQHRAPAKWISFPSMLASPHRALARPAQHLQLLSSHPPSSVYHSNVKFS